MASQKNFFIIGVLLSFIFVVRLFLFVMTDNRDTIVYAVELLNWGSVAVMAFCYSYLFPQFKEKDERAQTIRQKGIYYAMFVMIISLIIIMLLIQYSILSLTTLAVVRILISLVLITISLSWVILAKKM
ncbi:hypothetical protein M3212_16745 [Alkalihalobacillus oceani]|uniref:hypothetical protein n=1 Tax=Halalkalibacter oceani TaxID=1653776 RepID=UPI00203A497C|nr:hypothetical protein [Halalkalibacter oceani]MCM3762423.1 hypothetical protein [Halalkalibacter oceani]